MIRSRNRMNRRRRHVEEESSAPDVESLLLGPPPIIIMNMTNPLSDPTFNKTYQHSNSAATNPPSLQENNDEGDETPPVGGGESSSLVMNMTNPLSDPAFNETYQNYHHPVTTTSPPPSLDPNHDHDETTATHGMIIMNMTNPLEDPEFNSTYQQHSTDGNNYNKEDHIASLHKTSAPAGSPPSMIIIKNTTTTTTTHHPSIATSDPSHPSQSSQKPTTTKHSKNAPCTQSTGVRHMTCQANVLFQNHPYFVLAVACACCWTLLRLVRNRRRAPLSRGEYRAVAAHYIENDFDASLDDSDFEEEDEGWSTGKRTIEMTSFEEGGLTLEEVNG